MSDINPYSQHYRCVAQLFKNSTRNDIFMYLLDEHCAMIRNKKPPVVSTLLTKIEAMAGVNRNIVQSHLKALQEMGLIEVSDKTCTINTDYFIGVVTLYNQQKTTEEKSEVALAFREHDVKRLKELGFENSENGDAELKSLSGAMPISVQECSNVSIDANKLAQMPKSKHQCLNIGTNANILAQMPISMHECVFRGTLRHVYESKQAFLDSICTLLSTENAKMYAEKLGTALFDEEPSPEKPIDELVFGFCAEILARQCLNLSTPMLTSVHKSAEKCQNVSTVNKYINKEEIKEMNEVNFHIGGEKEKVEEKPSINFGRVNPDIIFQSPEKEDEESEDENFQKSSERQKRREALRKAMNPYRDKPYYSKQELSAFLVSPILAAESPVKQCLWLFWDGIYSQYEAERYVEVPADEYGEPIEEASEYRPQDTEGFIITKEDAMRCLLMAYEDIKQNLKKGYLTFNDGDKEREIEIRQQEFDDFLPSIEHILDWETVENVEGKESWKVSLSTVRNIEADDVSQISSSMTKEEKRLRARQDRAYNVGLLNAEQSQLSDLEKVMRRFLKELVDMDEEGYGIKTCYNLQHLPMDGKYVAGHTMKPWCVKATGEFESVGMQDFYDVLNAKEVYKDGMDLDLRCVNVPFSYRKSLRWHQMHGMKSSLLDEIPSE